MTYSTDYYKGKKSKSRKIDRIIMEFREEFTEMKDIGLFRRKPVRIWKGIPDGNMIEEFIRNKLK